MKTGETWLLAGGVALLALTLAGLALHVPGTEALGIGRRADAFTALEALAGGLYLSLCVLILRMPAARGSRRLAIILVFAALLRLPLLLSPPFLSTDVYRYVWDGRVAAAGINPYRYLPDAPQLAFLRDTAVFPHINRAGTAHTIYPPTAQFVFRAVAMLGGGVLAMKAAMVAAECVAVAALLALLAQAGLPAERVALYAWNPLAIWAFAGNGHVDALAIALLALTLLAVARGRSGLAGTLGGAAIAVKFLPVLMLAPLWRRSRLRFALAAVLAVAVLYLPFIAVGWRVLGFLGGYAREEGLRSGTGLWPLDLAATLFTGVTGMHLPGFAPMLYLALAALVLGGVGLRMALRPLPADAGAAIGAMAAGMATLGVGGMLVISPHYDWYFAWLALPAVLAPSAAALFLSVAPVLLYLDPRFAFAADTTRLIWPSLVYLPAWGLALWPVLRPTPQAAAAQSWRA